MAPKKSFAAAVDAICTFLSARPSYCSGTYPVSSEQLALFYGSDGSNVNALFRAHIRINLAEATPQELNKLEATCQPATFGVNNENVYDESYRKAGKMDPTEFAANFDVEDSDLIDIVSQGLLEGDHEDRGIKLELYKLNVYGKDSFFKAHKDTPRSETMFGSLVIVFPTSHEGGEFVLRENEHEWPCVSYVSFFSDVEHEVRMMTSGHRVTLTYNLYFLTEADVPSPSIWTPEPYDQTLEEAIYKIYPVEDGTDVTSFRNNLKGPDAALGRVLSALGLSWNVRMFYRNLDYRDYLHSRIANLTQWGQMYYDVIHTVMQRSGAEVEYVTIHGTRQDEVRYLPEYPVQLAEVTGLENYPCESQLYSAYGNEPRIGHTYVNLYIVIDLPAPGARSINRLQV
ncbi:hypothetical protein EDD16DRAFT_1894176 [Pisolithus croceorrhizus]|nr:hypothetical protein EDD16DRAFT_1894176 [Pisolithus croceorrhizus]KAI6125288.1 hypothetical protein EV401DRAFT_2068351 [Pisolithus croceorrhizus]